MPARAAHEAPRSYQPQKRAICHLSREHARLREIIKQVNNFGIFGEADVTFLFHLWAWCHVALLSQYHSGVDLSSVDILDHISVCFAIMPWIEVVLHMHHRGVFGYLFYHRGTAEAIFVYGTLVCLCIALVGAVVIEVEWFDIVPLGTARFCVSCAVLTIFTQNVRFSQMLQTVLLSAAAFDWWSYLCIFK